jgi:hypothetical protein
MASKMHSQSPILLLQSKPRAIEALRRSRTTLPCCSAIQHVSHLRLTKYSTFLIKRCDTPLHRLADLADPSDYSTHENQLILARQLIRHGANVNAVSIPQDRTPSLYNACIGSNVTNLDFVELLLKEGANPNSQDHWGLTPLLCTVPYAPGAETICREPCLLV